MTTVGRFICLRCEARWEHTWWAGPVESTPSAATQCPKCGHLYCRLVWSRRR